MANIASVVWHTTGNVFGWAKLYGESSRLYAQTSALAWLAMNAEANIRQNEKITGYERGMSTSPQITTAVYGTEARFTALVAEIDSALATYRNVDPAGTRTPACVGMLRGLNAAAAHALGAEPALARLSSSDVEGLRLVTIEPIIADIGLEVNDTIGDQPGGVFRLHLATGAGRAVPITVEGNAYTAWAPSAMVLHLDKTVTTSEWQRGDWNSTTTRTEARFTRVRCLRILLARRV